MKAQLRDALAEAVERLDMVDAPGETIKALHRIEQIAHEGARLLRALDDGPPSAFGLLAPRGDFDVVPADTTGFGQQSENIGMSLARELLPVFKELMAARVEHTRTLNDRHKKPKKVRSPRKRGAE